MVPSTLTPTPAQFAAANSELVRKIWSETYYDSIRSQDNIYANQMGSKVSARPGDGDRVVEVVHDTAKGNGQEVIYGIKRESYVKGLRGISGAGGSTIFTSDDQYGTQEFGFDKVKVALYRQAHKHNAYTDDVMGWMVEDLGTGALELVARNVGRNLQRDLQMTTLWRSGTSNRYYAGGNTTLDELEGSDTLKLADLTVGQALLDQNGATPAKVRMDMNGNQNSCYHLITTGEGYAGLKADPAVRALLNATAAANGNANEQITGGLTTLDGHTVQYYKQVMHKDAGEVGSPFQPFAFLGVAIASGTTTAPIKGGRNNTDAAKTQINYFTDFPSGGGSSAYTFLNGDSMVVSYSGGNSIYASGAYYINNDFWGFRTAANASAWDAAPFFYIGISNPKNSAVDPGKWGMYKIAYSANNLNFLEGMVQRLGPAISGIAHTTVGAVTYDSAIHTNQHPVGANIYLCNARGVPIAATPMHGACSLRRAWGSLKNSYGTERYQKVHRLMYVDNIVGHGLRRDHAGEAVGIMNIVHAVRYYAFNHAFSHA